MREGVGLCFEEGTDSAVVGAVLFDEFPEFGAVVGVDDVCEFVYDYVFNAFEWFVGESEVECQ